MTPGELLDAQAAPATVFEADLEITRDAELLRRRTDGIARVNPISLKLSYAHDFFEPRQIPAAESHSLGLLSALSDSVASWVRGWRPFASSEGGAVKDEPQPPLEARGASLDWHPHMQRCAIGIGNVVSVSDLYEEGDSGHEGYSVRAQKWTKPLRHDRQRDVACLAWQPCRGTALAVGCRGGVCIWSSADERNVWRPSHGQTTRHEGADAIWRERDHGSDQPFLLAPPADVTATHDQRWLGNVRSDLGNGEGVGQEPDTADGPCVVLRVRQFLNSATRTAETVNEVESGGGASDHGRRPKLQYAPTTSLAWSPDGQFLASCTEADPAVLLWEVATGRCTSLQCAIGGVDRGYSLLKWSPDGRHLFAAAVSNRFRIWSVPNWSSAVWNLPARIRTACWSPTSDIIVYALFRGHTVYSLALSQLDQDSGELGAASQWRRAIHAQDVLFFQKDDFEAKQQDPGGPVGNGQPTAVEIAQLAWEPWGGDRLAIVFHRTRQGSAAGAEVALYSVTQDSRFGTPPRMSFSCLGKVASSAPGAGTGDVRTMLYPKAAAFAAAPRALRSLGRGGSGGRNLAEHACFDALLGVLWTTTQQDDLREEQVSNAVIKLQLVPMIFGQGLRRVAAVAARAAAPRRLRSMD